MEPISARSVTRRDVLRATSALAGGGLIAGLLPKGAWAATHHGIGGNNSRANLPSFAQQASAADRLAQMRAQGAAVPLEMQKIRDNIYWLHGPGGNMVALKGPDGKLLVDSSYLGVAPKLKASLDSISNAPLKILVNTHWHFDHTDGNAPIHQGGATICAHENTRKRLSTPQDVAAFGLHFDPAPEDALPAQTFAEAMRMYFDADEIELGYIPPAHTDGDISVKFVKNNVLHMGDVFFNKTYPFIDQSTGGSIDGMIAGAAKGLTLADAETIIVPGHGPLGDKTAMAGYREMLATIRDRVQAQKRAGKSLQDAIASKPTAEFDAAWGSGLVKPELFVTLVYSTI